MEVRVVGDAMYNIFDGCALPDDGLVRRSRYLGSNAAMFWELIFKIIELHEECTGGLQLYSPMIRCGRPVVFFM